MLEIHKNRLGAIVPEPQKSPTRAQVGVVDGTCQVRRLTRGKSTNPHGSRYALACAPVRGGNCGQLWQGIDTRARG
jgi:hypothetical protein